MCSHCSAVSNSKYLNYLKPLQLLWMEGMQNISFKSREGSGTCRMSKSLSGESSSHNIRHLDSINIPFVISSHNELRDCGLLPVPHLSISIVNKPSSDLDTIGLPDRNSRASQSLYAFQACQGCIMRPCINK